MLQVALDPLQVWRLSFQEHIREKFITDFAKDEGQGAIVEILLNCEGCLGDFECLSLAIKPLNQMNWASKLFVNYH